MTRSTSLSQSEHAACAGLQQDAAQQRVIALEDGASALVIGAPGTGKTSTLIEAVAERLNSRGYSSDEVLVLTTARSTATRLRDTIGLRIGVATGGPIARTVNSVAFEVVSHAARQAGAQPPRLLTGGEQDSDISQLLRGHEQDGSGPAWPEPLGPDVRGLRTFRTELRELMMRATEYGVSADRLRELGNLRGHPEWVAAADFIDEYYTVIASARTSQLDSAELVQFAVSALMAAGDVAAGLAPVRLVLVDDVQDFTTSGLALLRAFAARGAAIVAFGDPDLAVNVFRGGESDTLGRMADVLGIQELRTITLGTEYRQRAALRAFTRTITDRIGTAGIVGQRTATGLDGNGETVGDGHAPIVRIEAETPARERAALARCLREHHLLGGTPLTQLAVIVRSGSQIPAIARALALADVPTRTSVGSTPLREDNAALSLLSVVDLGIGRTPLTAERAIELLLGPFCGLDRLALRRLRLALRAEELAGGGHRSSDELLVEALASPGRFATIDHRVGRDAARLSETLDALAHAHAASGSTVEELLWLVWQRSAASSLWWEQSMGSGVVAAQANRNLDGIVAVFTAARRFVERDPTAGAAVFLDAVLDAEVPEDTLSPQAAGDAVLVTTPQGAVGLEFDVVAIVGLQDGSWPNLRLRGSLLNPGAFVRAVTGVEDAHLDDRKQVLSDELRMFALAASRARTHLILGAVSNDDASASTLFALVPPNAPVRTGTQRPLSLRGLVGRLRRELTMPRSGSAPSAARAPSDAAAALARLAAESVPGADPGQWHGLLETSSDLPVFAEDDVVPISPSRLQAFEDSALDWFIDTVSGTQASTAMGLGTIVHWAMETAEDASVDAVWSRIESRWAELQFESDWIGEQVRRTARILAAGVAEYLSDFDREGKKLIAAEGRFHLAIGTASVNGSIDRVERAEDGSVVIVDLKTGSPITKPDEIAVHPQLGAYQLAYADGVLDPFLAELGAHHSGGAKLVFVKKGVRGKLYREAGQAPLTDEQLDGFRTRIRQAAIMMAAAEFTGPAEVTRWGGDSARRRLARVRAVSSD